MRPFGFLAALLTFLATGAGAQSAMLTIELNKFDTSENGSCRAFFLFRNATAKSFSGFEMLLAVFDQNGVIDQLLSIDAAPLTAARTTLKIFEVPDIACDAISEILLHDMPICQPQNEELTDCFPFISLVSRTAAGLVK